MFFEVEKLQTNNSKQLLREAKKFPLCDFCTLPKIRKGESSSLIEALDYNTIAQIVRIAVMKSL